MNKFYSALAVLAVLALGVRAETDYVALEVIRDIQQGADNVNRIETLKVGGSADIDGTLNVDGASTFGSVTADAQSMGDVNVSTNVDLSKATITVTNGQIITLTSTFTELSNVGGAWTTTTNTFAAFSAAQAGRLFFIQASASNTDTISLAESGVLVSGGALSLGASDGFVAIVAATNVLRQVSAVMNN